jgi:hypothetical protein
MRFIFAIRYAYLKQQKGIVVEQKFWNFFGEVELRVCIEMELALLIAGLIGVE